MRGMEVDLNEVLANPKPQNPDLNCKPIQCDGEHGGGAKLIRESPSSGPLSLAPASAKSSRDTRFGMSFELFADTGAKERGPELGPSLAKVVQPEFGGRQGCPGAPWGRTWRFVWKGFHGVAGEGISRGVVTP